jgi:restriction system protein
MSGLDVESSMTSKNRWLWGAVASAAAPAPGQVSLKGISRLDWTLTKPTLDEWLAELHENEIDADKGDPEPDYFDDDEVEAQERNQQRVVWNFPSDQAFDEFVSTIGARSQSEVDLVLRHLLIPSCALGADHMKLDIYLTLREQGDPESIQMAAKMMRSTHFQRIYAYYGGKTSELPWEGIRWVLQLLPDKPATALVALDAYFLAHMWDMTDSLINAISDAEAVIRGRYIGVPETQEERRQALYDLSPRQFERLIQRLYQAQDYDAELTPSQRDRGRDVIARRSQPGTREHVLIECKRYAKTIPIQYVRALLGAVSNERASAGKLVTTSSFSKEARDEMKDNRRIELIDGLQLVVLLNEYLGWTWPTRLDSLTSEGNVGVRQH